MYDFSLFENHCRQICHRRRMRNLSKSPDYILNRQLATNFIPVKLYYNTNFEYRICKLKILLFIISQVFVFAVLTFDEFRGDESPIEQFQHASSLIRNFGPMAESIIVRGPAYSREGGDNYYNIRRLELISRHCSGNIKELQLLHFYLNETDTNTFVKSVLKMKMLSELLLGGVRSLDFSQILKIVKNLKNLSSFRFDNTAYDLTGRVKELCKLVQCAPKLQSFQFDVLPRKSSCYMDQRLNINAYRKLVDIVKSRPVDSHLRIFMEHKPIPKKSRDDSVTFVSSRHYDHWDWFYAD